jgi:hypothetical protein
MYWIKIDAEPDRGLGAEHWGEAALAKFEPFILYFRHPLF